jgi:hypothetical protein
VNFLGRKLCLLADCIDPGLKFWTEVLQLFVGEQSFLNNNEQLEQSG